MINLASRWPPPRLDISDIDVAPHYHAWFIGFIPDLNKPMFLLVGQFVGQFMVTVSADRSAKTLARHVAPFLTQDSQMAVYDTYAPGLIFYLRLDRPVWIVAAPRDSRESMNIF